MEMLHNMGNNLIQTKLCSKCKQIKPADRYTKFPRNKDGLNSYCKDCMYKYDKERRLRLHPPKPEVEVPEGSKYCNDCESIKPLEQFGNSKASKDGKRSQCKICNCNRAKKYVQENNEEVNKKKRERRKDPEVKAKESEYRKEVYWNNREEDLARQREYRRVNHAQELERYRRYHRNNKQKELKYAAVYREVNRDYRNEKRRIHRKEFPHLANANTSKRRSQKIKATPSWANPASILCFYEHAVLMSKVTGIKHEVDHIIPLTSELVCGLHTENNLRVITKSENATKHNKFIPYSEDRYGNITYYP